MLFGYDTGVISVAALMVQDEFELSTFEMEWFVSCTTLAAAAGSGAAFCTKWSDCCGSAPLSTVARAFSTTSGGTPLRAR